MAKKKLNETEKFELEQRKKVEVQPKETFKPSVVEEQEVETVTLPPQEDRVTFLKGEVDKVVEILGKLNLSNVSAETRINIVKLKLLLNKEAEEIKKVQVEIANTIKPDDFDKRMKEATAENAPEDLKNEWDIYLRNLDNKFRKEITPYFLQAIVVDFKPIENKEDYDKILSDTTKITEVQELEYIYYKLFKQ